MSPSQAIDRRFTPVRRLINTFNRAIARAHWLTPLLAYAAGSYAMLVGPGRVADLTHVYLGGGEVVGWSAEMWWFDYALFTLHVNPLRLPHFYPFHVGVSDGTLPLALLSPIAHFFGSVAAYNLYVLAAFTFAGLTMYLLLEWMFHSRGPAFLGGVLFTFSAQHFAQGSSHLHVYSTFWIPAIVLIFLKFVNSPNAMRGAALGLLIALTGLTSWTLAVMAILFCVFYALGRLLSLPWRKMIPGLLVGTAVCVALVFPSLLAILSLRAYPEAKFGIDDSIFWSADLLGFVTPPPQNRLLGPLFAPLFGRFTGNVWEATVYLGIVPLTLFSLASLFRPIPSRVRIFLYQAVVFVLLSLGPILQIAGISRFTSAKLTILLPGALAPFIPILDMMRTPNRYGIMLLFCVIVVATYSLDSLLRGHLRLSRFPKSAVVPLLVIAALLDSAYRFPRQRVRPVPEAYRDISRNADSGALLEVPAIRSPLARGKMHNGLLLYYYEYQKFHHRPLVGGYFNRVNPAHARFMNSDPVLSLLFGGPADILLPPIANPIDYLFQRYGIRYVVLHKSWLRNQEVQSFTRFLGSSFYDDDSVPEDVLRVYEFRGQPRSESSNVSVSLGRGWFSLESWGETEIRWMNASAGLLIRSDQPCNLHLSFEARAVHGSRHIIAEFPDGATSSRLISESWSTISFAFPVHSKQAVLRLRVPEGAVKPSSINPSSADNRDLAIAVRAVYLRPTNIAYP